MSNLPSDTIARLSLPGGAANTALAEPSEIEHLVMDLFDEFRIPMLRYTHSLGLSIHDGEEVVQEVFLALFRHLSLGKPRQNLRGWIFCVTHNLALKQRPREGQSDSKVAECQLDPSPNPEDRAVATQRRRRLLTVVHALPEQDQFCLRLRAEGLRYREIAHALGISLGAVSISLTRSLARLMRADEV